MIIDITAGHQFVHQPTKERIWTTLGGGEDLKHRISKEIREGKCYFPSLVDQGALEDVLSSQEVTPNGL